MGNTWLFGLVLAILLVVGNTLEKASCPRPLNIVFLLKWSKNMNDQIIPTAKGFIKQTADAYQISPGQTNMAVYCFGLNGTIAVQFGQDDSNLFKQEVDKLTFSEEEPFIASYDGIFDRAIPYAARAVIVMTTGSDDDTDSPAFNQVIKDMRKSNATHVFALQLTDGRDHRRLLDIATDYDLIFNVNELLRNRKEQQKFDFKICNSLGDIRLRGKSLNRGCLEVYKNKTWSPVCSPTWSNTFTDLICQRLGFSINGSVGNDSDSVLSLLTSQTCGSKNSSIEHGCNESRNSSHCSSCLEIVCEVPFRLSGSPSRPHIGLLEVRFLDTWGTVCSDSFAEHGANLVCQNLGYPKKSLITFVDVSNKMSNLPAMLMSIVCAVETGTLGQNCTLIRCDRKCATSCATRPASILCDHNQRGVSDKKSISGSEGTKITIPCTIHDAQSVKWYYENGQERREISRDGFRIKYANKNDKESYMIIRKILMKDSGAYFCESGNNSKMTFLSIKVNADKFGSTQYFNSGQDGILQCNVFGSPPPKIEWKKNGNLIGMERECLWKYAFQEDGTLLIRNISVQDLGEYECKFQQNLEGVVNHERRMIRLLLHEKAHASIYDFNRTVEIDKPLFLKCSVKGRPKPNVTWYRNNTAIPRQKYLEDSIDEGYVVQLYIPNVTSQDYGMYTCTARNHAGSESASVWITPPIDIPQTDQGNDAPISTNSWQLPLIVGLSIVCGLGLVIWIIHRKRRQNSNPEKMSELFIISSKSCDIWELPKGSLYLEKVIGKGMFGEVWKAAALYKTKNKHGSTSQQTVAVKKPKDEGSDVQKEMLRQEIDVNKSLSGRKHPNIVNFLGCFTNDDMVMMVTEYVPYGDLLGYLRESRGVKDRFYVHCEELPQKEQIAPYELFSFATQIACGMSFLAENKVIHRDLAARNVLVGENLVCKITDFGLAKVMKDGNGYMGSRKGRLPIKWTAPEVFFDNATITSQSDVWSYGITLYEIFTIGGDPYPGQSEWDIVYKIRTDKYTMPKPEHISDEIYDIMRACWGKEPKSRPTFEELHKQLTKMVETDHYLELDMTKYQSHIYANLDDMDEDLLI